MIGPFGPFVIHLGEPQAWPVDLYFECCLIAPPGGKSGQEHGLLPRRFLVASARCFYSNLRLHPGLSLAYQEES